MVEVAERFERGRGVEKNAERAVVWYRKAVRAQVPLAPAFVGETIFERAPIEGVVWLLLGLERAPDGSEAGAIITASLSQLEPRLNDAAIAAAQVWADACREREAWPDDVHAPLSIDDAFRPRAPTPPLPTRTPRVVEHVVKETSFGPWRVRLPPAASVNTIAVGLHVKATWGGVFTQHLVWATLARGIDIDTYVKRSIASTVRLWRLEQPAERVLLNGLDTTLLEFAGVGPSVGQRALKRFVTVGDQVAVLTAVAENQPFLEKHALLEAIADSITFSGSGVLANRHG